MEDILPAEIIEKRIYVFRGKKVMIDRDLAKLYEVKTMALNQAVRRNIHRFLEDFMFQLNKVEMKNWISQFVISNSEKMSIRKPPLVFTEHGITMLSTVLKSKKAIAINIQIIRTFIQLRDLAINHIDLHRKIELLEKQYDEKFKIVFDALHKILADETEKEPIGFKTEK